MSFVLRSFFFFFFFSSRRRHTRCLSDWSSDVCSSDLVHADRGRGRRRQRDLERPEAALGRDAAQRSEEHTSELQSLRHLVCRLLLEKKKKKKNNKINTKVKQNTQRTSHTATANQHSGS